MSYHHKPRSGGFKYRFLPHSTQGIDMDFDSIKKMCTEKRTYENKRIAKEEAKRLGLNYYRCHFCGKFHLTSRGSKSYQGERSRTYGRKP